LCDAFRFGLDGHIGNRQRDKSVAIEALSVSGGTKLRRERLDAALRTSDNVHSRAAYDEAVGEAATNSANACYENPAGHVSRVTASCRLFRTRLVGRVSAAMDRPGRREELELQLAIARSLDCSAHGSACQPIVVADDGDADRNHRTHAVRISASSVAALAGYQQTSRAQFVCALCHVTVACRYHPWTDLQQLFNDLVYQVHLYALFDQCP
jgi:hypothetical protein